MRVIKLTQGKEALVDDEDYEFLNQWKWSLANGYAQRQVGGRKNTKSVYMHCLIAGGKADHIDENPLNNQRSNLRRCTVQQNAMNRGPQENNTSGYKGVTWNKRDQGWTAQLHVLGKRKFLGTYKDILEAAAAYDKAARELHGEFAYQNLET